MKLTKKRQQILNLIQSSDTPINAKFLKSKVDFDLSTIYRALEFLEKNNLSYKIDKTNFENDFARNKLRNLIIPKFSEINEKYRLKGEYENTISQINEVDSVLEEIENELENIDQYLYSSTFQEKLKKQITKFNKYFSSVSYELYGERYALTYDIINNKKTNKPVYKFSTFNSNMSSGKKQGEILCFDLAYIMFADEEGISCLHFLLNDKKFHKIN